MTIFRTADYVRGKKGWDVEGRIGQVLGDNVYAKQWWTPVKWFNEDDPTFVKTGAIEAFTPIRIVNWEISTHVPHLYSENGDYNENAAVFYYLHANLSDGTRHVVSISLKDVEKINATEYNDSIVASIIKSATGKEIYLLPD